MNKYNVVYAFRYDFDGEDYIDLDNPHSVIIESASPISISEAERIIPYNPTVLLAKKEDPDEEYITSIQVERVTLVSSPLSNKELSLMENLHLANDEDRF